MAKLLVGGAEFLFRSVAGIDGSGATTTGTGTGIVTATGKELFNMPVFTNRIQITLLKNFNCFPFATNLQAI